MRLPQVERCLVNIQSMQPRGGRSQSEAGDKASVSRSLMPGTPVCKLLPFVSTVRAPLGDRPKRRQPRCERPARAPCSSAAAWSHHHFLAASAIDS